MGGLLVLFPQEEAKGMSATRLNLSSSLTLLICHPRRQPNLVDTGKPRDWSEVERLEPLPHKSGGQGSSYLKQCGSACFNSDDVSALPQIVHFAEIFFSTS